MDPWAPIVVAGCLCQVLAGEEVFLVLEEYRQAVVADFRRLIVLMGLRRLTPLLPEVMICHSLPTILILRRPDMAEECSPVVAVVVSHTVTNTTDFLKLGMVVKCRGQDAEEQLLARCHMPDEDCRHFPIGTVRCLRVVIKDTSQRDEPKGGRI